jgi:autotransporter-associated beta strand protein
MPNTIPNGPDDIATFDQSDVTDLSLIGTIELSSVHFDAAAAPFLINANEAAVIFIGGDGIINDSGIIQTFTQSGTEISNGGIEFSNNANAGEMTSFEIFGGSALFEDSTNAGAASFVITYGVNGLQGLLFFFDDSSAANATIATNSNATTTFDDNSTAGNATFITGLGGDVVFGVQSTAANAVVNSSDGGGTEFTDFATAAQGIFTAGGATTSTESGSYVNFSDSTTAADATIVINGGTVQDAAGAVMTFFENSTAGSATLTANGGVNGGEGGAVLFVGRSQGDNSTISLFGNGELDIGNNRATLGVTIGSLAGNGLVFLGPRVLSIGSNNQSTTFSGVIQDGGDNQGTGGSLTKIGTGTLTLSGANTYTGATTVSAGTLVVSNMTGSGTGAGTASVNAGTLGGSGIISGAVGVGTGSGSGAFLAPAVGTNKQATLTIQSALTFNTDATYTYTFKAKKKKARTDKVMANGVTINGASFAFQGIAQGTLKTGLILTAISNTAATPISGTFANLPDGAILTVNGNNFQASYEGGAGNDLTLMVVP